MRHETPGSETMAQQASPVSACLLWSPFPRSHRGHGDGSGWTFAHAVDCITGDLCAHWAAENLPTKSGLVSAVSARYELSAALGTVDLAHLLCPHPRPQFGNRLFPSVSPPPLLVTFSPTSDYVFSASSPFLGPLLPGSPSPPPMEMWLFTSLSQESSLIQHELIPSSDFSFPLVVAPWFSLPTPEPHFQLLMRHLTTGGQMHQIQLAPGLINLFFHPSVPAALSVHHGPPLAGQVQDFALILLSLPSFSFSLHI